MPSKSKAQQRWVASPAGKKALGAKKQKEWLKKDKGKILPARAPKHRKNQRKKD